MGESSTMVEFNLQMQNIINTPEIIMHNLATMNPSSQRDFKLAILNLLGFRRHNIWVVYLEETGVSKPVEIKIFEKFEQWAARRGSELELDIDIYAISNLKTLLSLCLDLECIIMPLTSFRHGCVAQCA